MAKRWNKFWNTDKAVKEMMFKDKNIKQHSDNYIIPWIRKTLSKGMPRTEIDKMINQAKEIGMTKKELSVYVQTTLNTNKKRIADRKRLQGLTGVSEERLSPLFGGEFVEKDIKKDIENLFDVSEFIDKGKKFDLSKTKTREQAINRIQNLNKIYKRDLDEKANLFIENYIRAIEKNIFPPPQDLINDIRSLNSDTTLYFSKIAPPIGMIYREEDKWLLLSKIREALYTVTYIKENISENPTYEEFQELEYKGKSEWGS